MKKITKKKAFIVRLPETLHDKLRIFAAYQKVSMQTIVVGLLESLLKGK